MLELAKRVGVFVTGKRIDGFYEDCDGEKGNVLTTQQSMLEAFERWSVVNL